MASKKYKPSKTMPTDMRMETDPDFGMVFFVDDRHGDEWIKLTLEQALQAGYLEEIPEEKFCSLCHVDNGHLPECKIGKYEQIEKIVLGDKS